MPNARAPSGAVAYLTNSVAAGIPFRSSPIVPQGQNDTFVIGLDASKWPGDRRHLFSCR